VEIIPQHRRGLVVVLNGIVYLPESRGEAAQYIRDFRNNADGPDDLPDWDHVEASYPPFL
jgi:hypothetical protein